MFNPANWDLLGHVLLGSVVLVELVDDGGFSTGLEGSKLVGDAVDEDLGVGHGHELPVRVELHLLVPVVDRELDGHHVCSRIVLTRRG